MNCAACTEKRLHSEEEWKNHPHRGYGFNKRARLDPTRDRTES
jgi:hypothetical protein